MHNFFMTVAEATPITSSDFQSVLEALQNQISVQSIVGVLAVVVGACVGFVFMWWGVRKLISRVMKSAKSGSLNV